MRSEEPSNSPPAPRQPGLSAQIHGHACPEHTRARGGLACAGAEARRRGTARRVSCGAEAEEAVRRVRDWARCRSDHSSQLMMPDGCGCTSFLFTRGTGLRTARTAQGLSQRGCRLMAREEANPPQLPVGILLRALLLWTSLCLIWLVRRRHVFVGLPRPLLSLIRQKYLQ